MAAIDHKLIEEAAGNAHHKVAVLQGLMRSERGRQKTAIILGLINSLEEDTGDIVGWICEARSREEPSDYPTQAELAM